MEDEYISARQIAERYHFHPRSIYRMVQRGSLPPPDVVVGRVYRWRASTLEAWVAQKRDGHTDRH